MRTSPVMPKPELVAMKENEWALVELRGTPVPAKLVRITPASRWFRYEAPLASIQSTARLRLDGIPAATEITRIHFVAPMAASDAQEWIEKRDARVSAAKKERDEQKAIRQDEQRRREALAEIVRGRGYEATVQDAEFKTGAGLDEFRILVPRQHSAAFAHSLAKREDLKWNFTK